MAITALAVLVALLFWVFGSVITRLVGAVAALEGLLRIGFTGATPMAFALLAGGMLTWMIGHWIWAYKHKTWRSSRLALNTYSLALIRHLAPITTKPQKRPIPAVPMAKDSNL